ncbi:MAG: hypothetical protein ACI4TD_11845 [Phocaeicola sp.]
MAHFRICFVNQAKIIFEDIYVTGRKERTSVIKKVYGAEEAKRNDYYYVRKPNKYGIKWVIVDKDGWQGDTVASTGKLPNCAKICIYKMYK